MKINLLSSTKPLHIFYLPFFFVCNHFFTIVTPQDPQLVDNYWPWILNFFEAIGVCISFSFGVYKVISLRFRNAKGAILTTLLLFPFFFFQDFFLAAMQGAFPGMRARWMLPLFGILVCCLCYFVVKSKKNFFALTRYLNAVFFILSIYTIVAVVVSFRNNSPKALTFIPASRKMDCSDCPDIYFYVLDSYTSNKSLREHFNFDNVKFTEQLTRLGFSVRDQSISSYKQTVYSLGAILNFNQVKDLDRYILIRESIRTNAVMNSLMMKNYAIHNYSLFDIGDQEAYYNLIPNTPFGPINGIISSSILNIVVFDFLLKLRLYDINTSILERVLMELKTPHKNPQFFYCHLLSPHPPFVMDENGQELGFFKQPRNSANETAYKNQVMGINKVMLANISNVIKASPNAIIIIMGDHGYRLLSGPGGVEESYTAFLAYRGPNQEALDSLTKSNQIFQLVFDSGQ